MLIEHLLATKGRDVVTLRPEESVAATVAALREHRIGAVVVSEDGATVAGIVSERDIVRAIADLGAAALDEPVAAVMTAEVVTCGPDDRVEDLMSRMTDGRFRHLPVLVEGQLAGIVSIGDIVKHRVGELAQEAQALHEYVTSGR